MTRRSFIPTANRHRRKRWHIVVYIAVIIVMANYLTDMFVSFENGETTEVIEFDSFQKPSDDDVMNFDNFNNVTGAENLIVPNIIHFIHFDKTELNFVDYIVLRAAMQNHKPDKFYIHSNIPRVNLTGRYWDLVRSYNDLWMRVEVLYLKAPSEIFGQKLSEKWQLYHGSDIGRILLLMKYGGIFLENDVYIVKNLNKYRKYEFVINWEENQFMGTQVIVAHKDARFLRAWLDTYKEYHSKNWYFNAGERPTMQVLYHHPELVHRLKGDFGTRASVSMSLYRNPKFKWKKYDAIHLLMGYRPFLDKNYNITGEFNEKNIQIYKNPFGEMARQALGIST